MTGRTDGPRSAGALGTGEWWREGVVYQVYPRSFADGNGDGIGDLRGLIDHLDHLGPDGLGVDALWVSPIYPSPGLDLGYDVSDHAAVDPVMGTDADLDELVARAHELGIRVLLDLVLNHTSDAHRWFEASRASRTGEHADWYIWADPSGRDRRGRPRPPNNWVSFFGGSAWAWEPRREQFYLHTFLPQQPDVNWRNPALRAAQFDMVRGWLRRGVDGFRLDVFNAFVKDEHLRRNPGRRPARRAWDRQRHIHDKDRPELDAVLAEFRAILDEQPGRMSVGELFEGGTELSARLTTDRHLVFDFSLLEQPWSAAAVRRAIVAREASIGPARWPTVVLGNHDRSRQASRYGRPSDGADPDAIVKAAAVLLLGLRGTPFLYYGEEIGMRDVPVPKGQIVDGAARRATLLSPWWNRDQCRSPMPWTGERGAGFTTGRPWLPIADDYPVRNVAAQSADPGSVLWTYRRLLTARHELSALRAGAMRVLPIEDRNVVAWVREGAGRPVLVAVNFAGRSARLTLPGGASPGAWEWVAGTHASGVGGGSGASLVLRPHEGAWFVAS